MTNDYGEVAEVVEKPNNSPSYMVMTGFYTFSPAIFHARYFVQPSDRGEYELSEAIDLWYRDVELSMRFRSTGGGSKSAIPKTETSVRAD